MSSSVDAGAAKSDGSTGPDDLDALMPVQVAP